MGKFKMYLEVPTVVGTNTLIRLDKMSGFEDLVSIKEIILHLNEQLKQKVESGKKQFNVLPKAIGKDRFEGLKQAISLKQHHAIDWYVIVSDGSNPLVQIMAEMPEMEDSDV